MRTTMLARLSAAAIAIACLTAGGYAAHEMAVSGKAAASVSFTETNATNFTGITGSVTPAINFSQSYTSGTGTGQVNKKWCDRRTIAASGADTLDVAGGVTNEFGVAQTFATLKVVQIKADSANTNDVWMGGAINRVASFLKDSSVVVVRPGYSLQLAGGKTGYTVTAGTGDDILLKNSAGTSGVTFEICIAGT